MKHDRTLIEQSIAKQYGILPSKQGNLHYSDWAKLVSGIMDDTPLGRVVAVRSEPDRDVLKKFTPEQNRIRAEWMRFLGGENSKSSAPEEQKKQIADLEKMIASMFQ